MEAGVYGRCKRKFTRIKVSLDLSKSLKQMVQSENVVEDICILLLYKRLHNFCYLYGKLGHLQSDCDDQESAENQPTSGKGDVGVRRSKRSEPLVALIPVGRQVLPSKHLERKSLRRI